MKRILATAALAIAPVAWAAVAASPTPSTTTVDYAARCKSLSEQWTAAVGTNGSNASLGKAKAKAAEADKECKSGKTADEKKGAADYEAALKLLGVTPA